METSVHDPESFNRRHEAGVLDSRQYPTDRVIARMMPWLSRRFYIDAGSSQRYECIMKRDLITFATIALLLLLICATVAGVAMRLYEAVG